MKKNTAIAPLTQEERISWKEHLEFFRDYGQSGINFLMRLVDVRKRELWREDYDSWDDFYAHAPWIQGQNKSRQVRSLDKKGAEILDHLSTAVDNEVLMGLSPNALRCLRSVVQNPIHQHELLNWMVAQGLPINEGTIDRCYVRFLQQKEDEIKKEEAEGAALLGHNPDAADGEEDEEEETDEETADEEKEVVVEMAKKTAKDPGYTDRFIDYARLLAKNGKKITSAMLRDEEKKQRVLEAINGIEEAALYLRGVVEAAEG